MLGWLKVSLVEGCVGCRVELWVGEVAQNERKMFPKLSHVGPKLHPFRESPGGPMHKTP